MSSPLARALVCALSLALLLVATATAHAGTVTKTTDGAGQPIVLYTGTEGVNDVNVGYDDATAAIQISSTSENMVGQDGCQTDPADTEVALCGASGITAIVVRTLGGDDGVYIGSHYGDPPVRTIVDGGDGNDELISNDTGDTLIGGSGNDVLEGRGGDDVLDGGDGNDKVEGGAGADEVRGGAGDDILSGDGFEAPSPDIIDGGPGFDQVDEWVIPSSDFPQPPVDITLDGAANDGRPGEGDNVVNVERIKANSGGRIVGADAGEVLESWGNYTHGVTLIGNGGNDQLVAGAKPDALDGGPGDDHVEGGLGDDVLTGGPGRDTIFGDSTGSSCDLFGCTFPYGNDTIHARDGEVDSIDCGLGTDTVFADPEDVIAANCEVVNRGTTAPGTTALGGGGSPATTAVRDAAKLRVLRAGIKSGRLDLLAEVTRRATGRVSVRLTAGGRKHSFTVAIASTGRVLVDRRIPSAMRRARSGIVELSYVGDQRVRPDHVRLRAASEKANLRRTATTLTGGRLRVSGTISSRARGVVRVRHDYVEPDGTVKSLDLRAPIRSGKWALSQQLTGAAAQGGQLSIQFTGYRRANMRGEQTAKQVP